MNERIQEICEQIAENRKAVKKASFGAMELVRSAAAALITCAGQDADTERIKECKKILKKNQGIFSDFRGYSQLVIMSKMSIQEDPEQYLSDASAVYKEIREGRFFTNEIMALAAMCIVDAGRTAESSEIAEKTRTLLKEMNDRHPFLVNNGSTAYAALLALTPKSVPQILDEVEACYEIVKDRFPLHKDAEYALCQVLSIYDGDPEAKCERAMGLFQKFRDSGVRYGKDHELAFLGVLANLDESDDVIISEVTDACDCLRQYPGFGFFSMNKQTRLLFGSMITACYHAADVKDTASAVSNAISMAIVQEIMTMIILASTYAAIQSSRSSSSNS